MIKLREKQKIRQILYVSTSKTPKAPHLNNLLTNLADFKTKTKIILKFICWFAPAVRPEQTTLPERPKQTTPLERRAPIFSEQAHFWGFHYN